MQAKQFHTIYSLTTAYSNDIIKKMNIKHQVSDVGVYVNGSDEKGNR